MSEPEVSAILRELMMDEQRVAKILYAIIKREQKKKPEPEVGRFTFTDELDKYGIPTKAKPSPRATPEEIEHRKSMWALLNGYSGPVASTTEREANGTSAPKLAERPSSRDAGSPRGSPGTNGAGKSAQGAIPRKTPASAGSVHGRELKASQPADTEGFPF